MSVNCFLWVSVFLCVIGLGFSRRVAATDSDQDLLFRYLFEHKQYDPLARPVLLHNETVSVNVGLAMIQIVQLEEKYQRLKSNVWIRMSWHDDRLAWRPVDFGGIETLNIAPEKMWKPDIVLLNNVDGNFEALWKPNLVLSSNGDVLWIPTAIFKSSCEIDVRFFPFDQQSCTMELGSWTYTRDEVILKLYENQDNIDLSDYVTSGTWDFVAGPVDFRVDAPTTVEAPRNLPENARIGRASFRPAISRMVFHVVLRRKPLFYITNLIVPCVLIGILSISVFCLPADAGEKVTLSISILVTLVVYMLLVSKMLPSGPKTIPLLSQLLLFNFAMTFLSLFITTGVIINLNHRNPKTHPQMPVWVRRIFIDWLPGVLCLQRPIEEYVQEPQEAANASELGNVCQSDGDEPSIGASGAGTIPNSHDGDGMVMHNRWSDLAQKELRKRHAPLLIQSDPSPNLLNSLDFHLKVIMESVDYITKQVIVRQREHKITTDWKYVASVIDRVLLIIFTCVLLCGTLIILFSAPYILSSVDQAAIIKNFSYQNRN